jgi:arginase
MTILLPFHQDTRLLDGNIDLPSGPAVTVVEPDLRGNDQWTRLVRLFAHLAEAVQTVEGPVTVVTGDCLAAAGTLAGVQRRGLDPAVVWFDAHGDTHTLASSTSGYLGGTALRVLMGGDPDRWGGPLGLRPVPEEKCVLVGARDVDPAEEEFLAGSGVRRFPVSDLDSARLPDGPILIHLDLDVIDGSELPGLRFPVSNGPSESAVLEAIGRIRATGRVVALDIACPWHDPADEDQAAARRSLLARLLDPRN